MTPGSVVTGLASNGKVLAFADIVVTDAKGRKVFSQTQGDGSFWFSFAGRAFPLIVQVSDPLVAGQRWVAVMAAVPDASDNAGHILNVNPLTTAQAALLIPDGHLSQLDDATTASNLVTPAALALATNKLAAILAPTLRLEQIDAATFDPRNALSTSTYQGLNALLLDVTVDTADGAVLSVNGMPESLSSRTLMRGTSAVPVTPPPVAAHYLVDIQQQAGTCLAGASSTQPSSASICVLPGQVPAVSGLAWGTPRTLQFLAARDGNLRAVVNVPYQTAAGQRGAYVVHAVTVDGADAVTFTAPYQDWRVTTIND